MSVNLSSAEAKRVFVEKYFDTVYRLAFSHTRNKDYADDILQDVFLRFIKTDTEFETEEHIKAWLIRVTINCTKSLYTSSWFKKTVELTDDIVFETEEYGDAYYATQSLPPKYRTVVHLFYFEDMPISQIAKTLNTKESTVKSQLHRAREMLKEKLKGEYDFV